MIVVKLQGGLGNQLFQYAFGRNLAIQNKTSLDLDVQFYTQDWKKGTTKREYALSHFNIQGNVLSPEHDTSIKKIMKIFHLPTTRMPVYRESDMNSDQMLPALTNAYIDGYWQSENYFKNIEQVIRNEYTLKKPLSSTASALATSIKSAQSVSLHVRRGDYVNDRKTHDFHGTCSTEYYKKAINLLKNKLGTFHIFVFSDDIAWAQENIHSDHPITYISQENLPDYEELILMSLCNHNIIANSTFSWWGAWLNSNSEKIVIAPQKWFANQTISCKGILPSSWIKL